MVLDKTYGFTGEAALGPQANAMAALIGAAYDWGGCKWDLYVPGALPAIYSLTVLKGCSPPLLHLVCSFRMKLNRPPPAGGWLYQHKCGGTKQRCRPQ